MVFLNITLALYNAIFLVTLHQGRYSPHLLMTLVFANYLTANWPNLRAIFRISDTQTVSVISEFQLTKLSASDLWISK